MTATEYLILVDENDKEIGIEEKIIAHQKNLLHRAFSAFIFRKQPRLETLLQQRALHKYHSRGLWTNSCCSHPRPGESIEEAGQRRLKVELGISVTLKDLGWFHYNVALEDGMYENEIDHVLIGFVPEDVKVIINKDEVLTYRWITLPDLKKEVAEHPENFTYWLAPAIEIVEKKLVMEKKW